MPLNFLNNGYFAGSVGVGTNTFSTGRVVISQSGGTQLHLISPTDTSGSVEVTLRLTSSIDYRGRGIQFDNSYAAGKWFTGVPYQGGAYSIGYHATQPEYRANSKLFINTSGDVGVGTVSPDSRLTVSSGTTNAVANFKSTDAAAYIAIADNSSTNALVNQIGVTGNDMWFATDDVEKLRITSSGQVGIGGTPQTTLADAVTIEIGASGIIYSEKAASQYNSLSIGSNWYYDSTNSRVEYKNAVIPGATNYLQYQGEHVFRTAVAPTAADDPITWSNRLIISNDGDIGIGSGTINGRVDIKMDMVGESFVPDGKRSMG